MTRDEAVVLAQEFAELRRHSLGKLLHAELKSQRDPESFPDDIRDTFFNHWVIAFAFPAALSGNDLLWYEWNLKLDPTDGEFENADLFIINDQTGKVRWLTPPMPFSFQLLTYAMLPVNSAFALVAKLLLKPPIAKSKQKTTYGFRVGQPGHCISGVPP
jgi:hypothetical protein